MSEREAPLVLRPYLSDPKISEIRLLGQGCFFIREGIKHYTKLKNTDPESLRNELLAYGRGETDNHRPLRTVTLPGGDRCHIALNTVSNPPSITIRRYLPDMFTSFELIAKAGSMPVWLVPFLKGAVKAKLNILVAGGLGCGKTTWLRIIGATFPEDERVGTIEDDPELHLEDVRHFRVQSADGEIHSVMGDCFALYCQEYNLESGNKLDLGELVKESLRMSAERILVGEVRGKEALDMIKAMNSGYPGSACTIHADSASESLQQLLFYCLEHPDGGKDMDNMMRRICRTIHLVIYLRNLKMNDGRRKPIVDHMAIVTGFNEDTKIPMITNVMHFDESTSGWSWTGGPTTSMGTDAWRNRFRLANVDLKTIMNPASSPPPPAPR